MNYKYFEDVIDVVTDIEIYTGLEVRPNNSCTWYYQIIAKNILDEYLFVENENGNALLCRCLECDYMSGEIFEYFSVYKALAWIKDNYPQTSVSLWVTSKEFLFDENEDVLWHYNKIYKCAFLQTLGKDLSHLLSKIKVEALHYS
jgi:hypothetical protein